MTTQRRWLAILAFMLTAMVAGAQAAPPTFRISQVFTAPDGRWQFVELTEFAGADDQHRWRGLTLTITGAGGRVKTVTFSEDLPTTRTAHLTVMVMTTLYDPEAPWIADFVEEQGDHVVYYAMPLWFVDTRGGTLVFAGADSVALPALPLDGVHAFVRDGPVAPATRPHACTTPPCGRIPVEAVDVAVTELYHTDNFAFLPTADALELEAQSEGRIPGWRVLGTAFVASASPRGTQTVPVCRFYAPSASGGGHVLTAFADECAALALPGSGFVLETPAAFYVSLPDATTGACAGQPVYRYWNSSNGADHRYSVYKIPLGLSLAPLRGYVSEGRGPDGVAFCAAYAYYEEQ